MSEAIDTATFVMEEDSCIPAAEEAVLESRRPLDPVVVASSLDASNALLVVASNFIVTS